MLVTRLDAKVKLTVLFTSVTRLDAIGRAVLSSESFIRIGVFFCVCEKDSLSCERHIYLHSKWMNMLISLILIFWEYLLLHPTIKFEKYLNIHSQYHDLTKNCQLIVVYSHSTKYFYAHMHFCSKDFSRSQVNYVELTQ